MGALDAMDSATREVAVTRMLGEARTWLAHAVEATEPSSAAHFKAWAATVQETTKQLDMSKAIQVDALEMVRRGEHGVGKAVRKQQDEGTIGRRGGDQRKQTTDTTVCPSSPYDFASHVGVRRGAQAAG